MASIEPYETKEGKRWMVRYTDPSTRNPTKKRGFTTKRDATEYQATLKVSQLKGEYTRPTLGRITVAELAPDWLASKQPTSKPSYYRSLEASWRNHVAPKWGKTRLTDIDLGAVETWITSMSKAGLSATVIRRAYGILTGICDMAVKGKRISSNPARGAENLPKKNKKAEVYLDHEQVAALADASGGQHRLVVLVLTYTGLRWGEMVALQVQDIDFARRRINVHPLRGNAVEIGGRFTVGSPKGDAGRSVPLPRFLADELQEQIRARAADALVFPADDGGFFRRPKSPRGWLLRALEQAKLPTTLTPHDLRHTAASLAVSAGANIKALQRMLGHSSAAMTLDQYSVLFDDDLDAVATALDGARKVKRAQNVPTD